MATFGLMNETSWWRMNESAVAPGSHLENSLLNWGKLSEFYMTFFFPPLRFLISIFKRAETLEVEIW